MASVTEIPTPNEAETDDSADQTPFEEPTPKPEPPRNKAGRPPKGARKPPDVRQPLFFDKVAGVPKEDWGERAFMYVYADEPVCNKKTFGETRYLLKSSRPILDLEGLKQDYGSFKGWMSLNLRKSGKDATDEVDRLNFEIYDPKHPPRIPRSAWANDDRNKRWLDLLPPEPPPASAAASGFLDSIKVYKEIVNDVKGDMEPADDEPTDRTKETLETMKLAKELFAPPAAAAPVAPADPFDTAKKIMEMRGNDPMIALFMQRLEAADKAAEAARVREFELMKELRQHQNSAPKGIIDQLIEAIPVIDKLEPLLKKFGIGTGGGGDTAPVRTAKFTAYEMVKDIAQTDFGREVGQGLGILFASLGALAQRGQPQPAMNGQPAQQQPILNRQQSNATVPPNEPDHARLTRIETEVGQTMLFEYFLKGDHRDNMAEDFAVWMFNGKPEDYLFLKKTGAQELIRRAKSVPQVAAIIGPKEPAFVQFMQDVCAWNPDEDEDEPGKKQDDEITDLSEEES